MKFTNLIVVSIEDTASCNIQRTLLDLSDWQDHEPFDGTPTHIRGDTIMVTIKETHLYYDNIDDKLEEQLGIRPELIIFASRHRSESGLKTLTVHPLGNYTDAKFGGIPGKLVPSAPRKMTQALRIMAKEGSDLEHKISYEATHHGPYMSTPTFFIEIGSDENAWVEEAPAKVIARTILSVLDEPPDDSDKIALGIGGGHYVPRLTEVALSYHIAFGHMIPTYAADIPLEKFSVALSATPEVKYAYFHRKYLKKKRYRELKEWAETEAGLTVVDSKGLEPL